MSDQFEDMRHFGQQHGIALDHGATERPMVYLPGGSVKILDTARALYSIIAPKMEWFYRGGTVVLLTRETNESLPIVKILKPAQARSEFEKHADFLVQSEKGPKPSVMSEEAAKAILEASVAKEILPRLSGLINCPLTILDKGEFHILPAGYDSRTGYYVTGKAAKESATVEEAVMVIKGIIADYSFQTPGDVSRAIASILTPALKFGGFINGVVPIEIVEANDSQTGKGYFVLLRCAVYGEVPIYIAQKRGGVGSLDESFASGLIKGRPFVLIDNYRGSIDSPYLESFMTAQGQFFSVRVPYSGEVHLDPSKFLVAITSNGMEATKDLANRSSFIRLEKQYNYQFRKFAGNDILTAIRKYQPMFLGAVFKVIRHWFERGMPRTTDIRHTCRDWAQINDWIVQNIFDEAPLLDGHSEVQRRFQDADLSFARLLAVEIQSRQQLGFPFTATSLFELCEGAGIQIPQIGDQQHNQDHGKRVIGKIMNKLFGTADVFELESFTITRDVETHKTEAGNTQDKKQYTFTRTEEPGAAQETAA